MIKSISLVLLLAFVSTACETVILQDDTDTTDDPSSIKLEDKEKTSARQNLTLSEPSGLVWVIAIQPKRKLKKRKRIKKQARAKTKLIAKKSKSFEFVIPNEPLSPPTKYVSKTTDYYIP